MAIHPSPSKTLIAVGDKWGGLGLWDVDNPAGGEDGVYLFHPHANPINVLRWAPEETTAPTDLFTCSYDGTIRRGDFQKEVSFLLSLLFLSFFPYFFLFLSFFHSFFPSFH